MTTLARLEARVRQQETRAAEQEEVIAQQEELVGQLVTKVADLGDAPARRTELAPSWPDLSQDDAESTWYELDHWMRQYLLPRVSATARRTLRACWRRHPDVVDELSALRAAWYDAYRNPKASPTAAAVYLERWLPGALQRIDKAFISAGCKAGATSTHQDHNTADPPSWSDDELGEFLSEDLADRPEQTRN